jgi:hypothetical protein
MNKKKAKIPLSEVKKFPYITLKRLIDKGRAYLKNDKVWKEKCKEYDVDPDIIDIIPIRFGDLDVSAKTVKAVIILNYKLLCDGDFQKDYSYMIHELVHFLQQSFSNKPTKSSNDGDYLSNRFEQDAFKDQVEYIAEHQGKDKAEDYVDDLLEYHDVDGKKEKQLEDVLMEKV